MRLKAVVHLGEVDGTLALMNLHRISAAESDVRASLSGEMNEIALPAGSATRARLGSRDFCVLVRPDIEGKERPA